MAEEADRHVRAHRFVRFLLVGAVNTVFGYGLFALFILAGLGSAAALLLAMIGGVLFNFFSTGRLVFANRNKLLLPRFVAAYGVVYGVNLALLKLFESGGLTPLLAQAICFPPVVLLSFALLRTLVFRNRASP